MGHLELCNAATRCGMKNEEQVRECLRIISRCVRDLLDFLFPDPDAGPSGLLVSQLQEKSPALFLIKGGKN